MGQWGVKHAGALACGPERDPCSPSIHTLCAIPVKLPPGLFTGTCPAPSLLRRSHTQGQLGHSQEGTETVIKLPRGQAHGHLHGGQKQPERDMTELAERRPWGKGGKFHTLWLSKREKDTDFICVASAAYTKIKDFNMRENIHSYLYDPDARKAPVWFLNKH